MIHATIAPGAELRLPWRSDYNSLVYTLNGRGTIGEERNPIMNGQLAVLETTGNPDGDVLVIRADQSQESRSPQMDVLILGGLPIKEQIAWMGPFVMNTKAEVLKAFDDFSKGLLGTVPAEHQTHKPMHRTDKLGADVKQDALDARASEEQATEKARQVLNVHGAPTDI
jgi:redox-sensitive bicupin YhaK (pirin superfamily)